MIHDYFQQTHNINWGLTKFNILDSLVDFKFYSPTFFESGFFASPTYLRLIRFL